MDILLNLSTRFLRSFFLAASLVFASLSPSSAWAVDLLKPPESASSTTEIASWVEKHRGYGSPNSKIVELNGVKFFVIWNLPTSGNDIEYIYAYRRVESTWNLIDVSTKRGAPGISITILEEPSSLIYQDSKGREFKRISLEHAVPQSPRAKRPG